MLSAVKRLFIATSNVPGGFILLVEVSFESAFFIPKAVCISFMFTQTFLREPNLSSSDSANLGKFCCEPTVRNALLNGAS